jgi:hypothetical protein
MWIFATHVCGYSFCCFAFAMTMLAWVRGCAWPPAAARVMVGYAVTTAVTFGIEQTQLLAGHAHSPLLYLPPIIYLASLCIWYTVLPLDQPKPFTSEQMAHIEAALADSMGSAFRPGKRSTQG